MLRQIKYLDTVLSNFFEGKNIEGKCRCDGFYLLSKINGGKSDKAAIAHYISETLCYFGINPLNSEDQANRRILNILTRYESFGAEKLFAKWDAYKPREFLAAVAYMLMITIPLKHRNQEEINSIVYEAEKNVVKIYPEIAEQMSFFVRYFANNVCFAGMRSHIRKQ
jgi:hypothetical protein